MSKENNHVSLWERYFTKEIGIELKACLYFFAILFYYCCYRVCTGMRDASILHMAEMIFSTYVIGYLQVFLLWNFDEAEHLKKKELFGIALCSLLYTLLSWFLNWFQHNVIVVIGFCGYVIFMYFCVFWIYKARRKIDNKLLNESLSQFKARNKDHSAT